MNEHQKLAIQALENMRGNDTQRARMAFRNYSDREMQMEYGSSGKTRAEILAGRVAHDMRIDMAIEWIKSI